MKKFNFIALVLVLVSLALFAGCSNTFENQHPPQPVTVMIDLNSLLDANPATDASAGKDTSIDVTSQKRIDSAVERIIDGVNDGVWAQSLAQQMVSAEEEAKTLRANPRAYEREWIRGFTISVKSSLSQYTEEEQDAIVERTAKPLYNSFKSFLNSVIISDYGRNQIGEAIEATNDHPPDAATAE